MRKILAVVTALCVGGAFAETKTWTGGASGNWNVADNWDPSGVPAATDDVLIDGNVEVKWTTGDWSPNGTVTVSGGARLVQEGGMWPNWGADTHLILDNGTYDAGDAGQLRINAGRITIDHGGQLKYTGILTRSEGSSITVIDGTVPSEYSGNYSLYAVDTFKSGNFNIGNEFQPQNGAVIDGANWTCKLFAPQTANSVITAQAGSLTFTGGEAYNGFYQNGATYLNFPKSSTCSVTLLATAENIYSKTFGSTPSKYKYDGDSITSTQFDSLFEVSVNGDYATLKLVHASGEAAEFESASVGPAVGEGDGVVTVSATFVKEGDPAATLYFVWGDEDHGRKLADWGENRAGIGTANAGEGIVATVRGLAPRQMIRCRIIAVSDEASAASEPMSVYTRDYGVAGPVNEWLGLVGDWTDAAKWSLGRVPLATDVVWIENPGAVIARSGTLTIKPTDHLIKGAIDNGTGEISISADLTLDGFSLYGGTMVMNNSPTVTMKDGNLSCIRMAAPEQAPAGLYPPQAAAGHINFVAGKAISYSFVQSGDSPYADTFGRNRFFYNGDTLTAEQFAEKFTVTTEVVNEKTVVTMSLAELSGVPGIADSSVTYAEGEVAVAVTPTEDCAADTVFTFYYDTQDHEHNLADNWPNSVTLESVAGGGFGTVLRNLAQNTRYYYLIGASSASAGMTVWVNGHVVAADYPEDSNVWLGLSDELTNPQNWSKGAVPGATDIVELNDLFTIGDELAWNVDSIPAVAGWRQTAAVLVVFDTTLEKPFTVNGDVSLGSGANWTVAGPANVGVNPVHALNVKVTGAMTIADGATVQAGRNGDTKFKRGRGYRSCGPGWEELPREGQDNAYADYYGASFGGDGGYSTEIYPDGREFVTYGSIVNPLEWGASGHGDGGNLNYAGGGIVKLVVDGALTVAGSIESQGFGYPAVSTGGAASGGTINVTAATLAGEGEINADGGSDRLHGHGSGGRIRVKLTANGAKVPETLKIHAYGGTKLNGTTEPVLAGVVDAAAGTVVLQTADDAETAGRLVIANTPGRSAASGATHLPSTQDAETKFSGLTVEVAAGANVRLTADVSVSALKVAGVMVGGGNYTAVQLNALTGTTQFCGTGTLHIGKSGFMLFIR